MTAIGLQLQLPTPIPAEIKFLDDGTFTVTVKDDEGNIDETYVGYYELDIAHHKLEMDLNSTVSNYLYIMFKEIPLAVHLQNMIS